MKKIALLIGILILCSDAIAQKNWKNLFDKKYSEMCISTKTVREGFLEKSASGDSFDFMEMSNIIDALQCMYLSTEESSYRNDLIKIIDNILSTAFTSKDIPDNIYPYKDNYLSWISKNINTYHNEAPLLEGYIFRYITQFIYNLHKSGWTNISEANQTWYNNTLQFIEKNIWEKWVSRSNRVHYKPYTLFLGRRTHTASHWAYIALFLKEITSDPVIRTQCIEMYNMYDLLLKRNLKSNPEFPQAYIWNCSWDDVSGTQASIPNDVALQDVSHGNHVLSYLAISKKMADTNWSDAEMDSLCNTLKQVVYDKEQISFFDMVDGSSSSMFPGRGQYQAEGWIKLSWFNKEVRALYIDFAFRREPLVRQREMELQYYANLLYTEYLMK
ncbi:hypothetical protein [Agriterribacter humi]|uniref:hypothetical protein n=1 Tax=Agriterribacter humi TaxID=1104781 RepID=UPI0012650C09|nr:hypothetical protein [Agriterribacter humi]